MIPKMIHYCWFGGGKQSLLIKMCILSWKKRLPDYQIILWDEGNFDPSQHPFTAAAYKEKKYAFVSDYVRMYALSTMGGIYLDTDVEVLKSFDEFLDFSFFIGMEVVGGYGTNVIGSQKGHWLPKRMIEIYNRTTFKAQDIKSMVNVGLVTKLLKENGFTGENRRELINNDLALPMGVFCDAKGKTKKNDKTYSHHHYAGSWKRGTKGKVSRMARYLKKGVIKDVKFALKYISLKSKK